MSIEAEIKFPAILSDLIATSPYSTNRRPIWEAVGVSSAALSQYTLGRARPRFETLVALADFFGVTVDYLMTGRQTPRPVNDGSNSMVRYMDFALSDMRSKMGHSAWLTARVGEVLANGIAEAVERVTSVPYGEMLFSVEDALIVEQYSKATYVWNSTLGYDVIELPDGSVAAGKYLPVVAANLMSNPPRPYHFMVPAVSDVQFPKRIANMKRLLQREFGVPDERLRFCEFRRTTVPVVIGCCLYELDMPAFQSQRPSLALSLSNFITEAGALAFTCSADDNVSAEILLTPDRTRASFPLFKSVWNDATPVQ